MFTRSHVLLPEQFNTRQRMMIHFKLNILQLDEREKEKQKRRDKHELN